MTILRKVINPISMKERLKTRIEVEKACKSSIKYIPIKEKNGLYDYIRNTLTNNTLTNKWRY